MAQKKTTALRAEFLVFLFIAIGMLCANHLYAQYTKTKPITYRIDQVDPRFKFSQEELARAMESACSLWEKAAARKLFSAQKDGDIAIRLVYDYRQAACDQRRALLENLKIVRSSHESAQSHLAQLQSDFEMKQKVLAREITSYHARACVWDAERRHAESPQSLMHLQAMRDNLSSTAKDLQRRQEELNNQADELNAAFKRISAITEHLNLKTTEYNITGQRLGNEFCSGRYTSSGGKQSIIIYQFDNRFELARSLAHELGHALGLDHSKNSEALMYYHNKIKSLALAPDDIAALKALPRFQ